MPELPDLEVVKEVLRRRAVGQCTSEMGVAGRSTSFCRHCQPGSMFGGYEALSKAALSPPDELPPTVAVGIMGGE